MAIEETGFSVPNSVYLKLKKKIEHVIGFYDWLLHTVSSFGSELRNCQHVNMSTSVQDFDIDSVTVRVGLLIRYGKLE